MDAGLKKFIEENINLIQEGNFEQVYEMNVDIPKLTEVLLQAGIDPLQNLTYVPANYLSQTDIFSFKIPSHITRIEYGAFWNCECLNQVELPQGLKSIEAHAFGECHNLWQINFPSTLEYLGQEAFAETNLHDVVIPDLVSSIPKYCFEDCDQLEKIKLGKYCTKIESRAFAGCSKLRFIELNEGLEEIRSSAFAECYALKEIYIPSSVKKIEASPFYKIKDIKVLCVEDSYTHKWCKQNYQGYELI